MVVEAMRLPLPSAATSEFLIPFCVIVPVLAMEKSVVVAEAVEDEMRKAVVVPFAVLSEIASVAKGEVVPIPTLPVGLKVRFCCVPPFDV